MKKKDNKQLNTPLPTATQCLNLLKKTGCSADIIQHCLAVRDVAVRIAQKTNADICLVEAGALLHDIGRSKTHGIRHAVEGAALAKQLGLPDPLVRIIKCHIGAGIPRNEAESLGLPIQDYMPKTLEEKIVAHADNLIAGHKKQNIENEIAKAVQNGQKKYAERLQKLHEELSKRCGVNLDSI